MILQSSSSTAATRGPARQFSQFGARIIRQQLWVAWLAAWPAVGLWHPALASGQDLSQGQSAPDANAVAQPPAADRADQAPTAEQQAAFERELAGFNVARQRLAAALADQREVFIRYVNREDRSPQARREYVARRARVRQQLDETYAAALKVTDTGVLNETIAQFIVTTIAHRLKTNQYDQETFEGAAKMLDAGQTSTFLFQAAGRSAVVTGQFEIAKVLLQQLLDAGQAEEIDRVLHANLDQYQQQWEAEQAVLQQSAAADHLPRVQLETTQGEILLELFLDQAPTTVANFVKLVDDGFYDGLDFFQVIDNGLALTGDPAGIGTGNSGRFIRDEHLRDDARHALRGSLVMAKVPIDETGNFLPNSASSQFAILLLPVASAADTQTIFGRVIEGMDVVGYLNRVDPNQEHKKGELQKPADRILSATVVHRPAELPEPDYVESDRNAGSPVPAGP